MLFASVLRSFTGFGFALAAVPVFSFFLAPSDAVVLSSALALGVSVLGLRSFWGIIKLTRMLPLLLMSFLGTAVGAMLLAGLSPALFQLLVGLSVLGACLAITVSRPSRPLQLPGLDWLAGLVSGLMNGALAIPGPPMIVYAMLTEFDPSRSRALLMTFFLASAALALVSYGVAGIVRGDTLFYALLALPALYLGDRIGTTLFLRFGARFYRRVALIALAAIGVSITLKALV